MVFFMCGFFWFGDVQAVSAWDEVVSPRVLHRHLISVLRAVDYHRGR